MGLIVTPFGCQTIGLPDSLIARLFDCQVEERLENLSIRLR